jgi:hypothetical protein
LVDVEIDPVPTTFLTTMLNQNLDDQGIGCYIDIDDVYGVDDPGTIHVAHVPWEHGMFRGWHEANIE